MALKETFPTKAVDTAVTPLDWGKDKVTEGIVVPFSAEKDASGNKVAGTETIIGTDALSDALYNRMQKNGVAEKWSRRLAEKPIDAFKAGMRVIGVAAMAGMVYKTTGELPTHETAELIGPNADYLLATAGIVSGSVLGKERGEKIQTTSSEFILQAYTDPNTLPGQVYNAHTGKVMDRSTATESADFRVIPDMGVLYNTSTGEIENDTWFDTATGEIFNKDGVLDDDFSVDAEGRVVGSSYVPLRGNRDVAPVLDTATNEFNSNRVVDLETGVVFGTSRGALDPSDPSAGVYDLETKLVNVNDEYVDMTDNGARYKDGKKKKPITVTAPLGVHSGKDAQGKDALDTVTTRKTTRDQATKAKWSGSTTAGTLLPTEFGTKSVREDIRFMAENTGVIQIAKEESGFAQEALQKVREARISRLGMKKRKQAKKVQEKLDKAEKFDKKAEKKDRSLNLLVDELVSTSKKNVGHSPRFSHKVGKAGRRDLNAMYRAEKKAGKNRSKLDRKTVDRASRRINRYQERIDKLKG